MPEMLNVRSERDPRVYEGLDAAHTPRLFVPEQYVERDSWKLNRLAAWALLNAQKFPDRQFDVVWLGNRQTRFLRAEIQPTGTFGHEFGYSVEGADDFFLPHPSRIEDWSGTFTYTGRIEKALENGAQVFKPADLAPRN